METKQVNAGKQYNATEEQADIDEMNYWIAQKGADSLSEKKKLNLIIDAFHSF